MAIASAATDGSLEFSQSVQPVLAQKNRVDFLKATTAKDIENKRALWRSVAAQLRNRTKPPVASNQAGAAPEGPALTTSPARKLQRLLGEK